MALDVLLVGEQIAVGLVVLLVDERRQGVGAARQPRRLGDVLDAFALHPDLPIVAQGGEVFTAGLHRHGVPPVAIGLLRLQQIGWRVLVRQHPCIGGPVNFALQTPGIAADLDAVRC